MKKWLNSYGYYRITITPTSGGLLLQSNAERAFIVAQLQDLLSPRFLLGDTAAHKQFASCVDLLAFSITQHSVELLIFSIDKSMATYLARYITEHLYEYRSELAAHRLVHYARPHKTITKLSGVHQALSQSLEIHLLHDDWEYDRYSSIGFYLHDRRGDWMRTWRLAQLYENSVVNYYELIIERQHKSTPVSTTSMPSFYP